MFIKVYGFYLHTTLSLKQKTKRLGVWGAGFVLLLFFLQGNQRFMLFQKTSKQTNKKQVLSFIGGRG